MIFNIKVYNIQYSLMFKMFEAYFNRNLIEPRKI